MHCFGHIHEGWGAKLVTWRDKTTNTPSHLTDIDNGQSFTIAKFSNMKDGPRQSLSGDDVPMECFSTSHCSGDDHPLKWGYQTLFLNAAIEPSPHGKDDLRDYLPMQLPWIVDLELQSSKSTVRER